MAKPSFHQTDNLNFFLSQAYLFDNEDRFFAGWQLDESWVFCTVSWCISLFCAGAVIISAQILPSEGGYELIPDHDTLRVT